MMQSSWLQPFAQIGRELHFEFQLSYTESRFAALGRRIRSTGIPLLPEQRIDDEGIVAQRKADAILLSARHGAVRR